MDEDGAAPIWSPNSWDVFLGESRWVAIHASFGRGEGRWHLSIGFWLLERHVSLSFGGPR